MYKEATRPLISIIVPIYNAEKYINRCVDSILNQTYENIELILIDDGSIDLSASIIDQYAAIDSRVVVVHKDNSGVSDTRNCGLDLASGKFVGFVDADDYIEPDMYERLQEAILRTDADICCCGYYQEYSDFSYEINIAEEQVLNGTEDILGQYFRQDIRNGIYDGNWNKLFKREVLSDIRFKKIKHCEDVDFQFRVFNVSRVLICIPYMLYHYVSIGNSASNSAFNSDIEKILEVADNILYSVIGEHDSVKEHAYAFNLTWHLSLLQVICGEKGSIESKQCAERIEKRLRLDYRYYRNNKYSKRLDQYYLVAVKYHLMKPAFRFRKIVKGLIQIIK